MDTGRTRHLTRRKGKTIRMYRSTITAFERHSSWTGQGTLNTLARAGKVEAPVAALGDTTATFAGNARGRDTGDARAAEHCQGTGGQEGWVRLTRFQLGPSGCRRRGSQSGSHHRTLYRSQLHLDTHSVYSPSSVDVSRHSKPIAGSEAIWHAS